MILLAAAAFTVAAGVLIYALIRDHRELRRWQAERAREEHVLYLARRAREIRAGLDELGDDVIQHVFPAAPNGR